MKFKPKGEFFSVFGPGMSTLGERVWGASLNELKAYFRDKKVKITKIVRLR